MSALLYSHSYPPSTISLSPTESFLYPENFEKQQLLKVNRNLNNNNKTTNTKRKQNFKKNNYYKKISKSSNDKATKQSIFSQIKSSNFSGPIITPITVCTHDKDFSKPQFSKHSSSTPIYINNTTNNIYYHHSLHQSLDTTFSSPLNSNPLLINDKNLSYGTSEHPSMEYFMLPTSEINTIKPQDTEDEMISLFPLHQQGEKNIKTNNFNDINFQKMIYPSSNTTTTTPTTMEDNNNHNNTNNNNTNPTNNTNNTTTTTTTNTTSENPINKIEDSKDNHTHQHYVENPFYYETTNLPTLDSKVKPSYCCYCGNNQQKLNGHMENHQNNNVNNSNILMKTSQYTPQSIPIPTNVQTNYSSFDGIDNIEKTLEEVKELIEKSKALSLGEIVSPTNHTLNEKAVNTSEHSVPTESETKNETEKQNETESPNETETETPNEVLEQQLVKVENESDSQKDSSSNDNGNGNSFVKTTTLLTETITTTTTTTTMVKQLTKIEIEDNNVINEKQEVKEQTFTDKETKVEVVNGSEYEKSPKTEETTEKKEDIVKVYEEDKKEEDEDESVYSSPERANDSGFVSDDSTSCYSSRSSSPGRRRRKSSLKSPNFPGHRKSVQFSNDLEMVCLFECLDAPEDIGESPQFVVPDSKDITTEENEKKEPLKEVLYKNGICLINIPVFTPFDMMSNIMGLESIELVDGSILKGTIQVKNLAYHKSVVIRYTLDNWNTTKEAPAVYTSAVTNGTAFYSDVGLDLFTFTIDMTSQFNAFNNSLVPHFADHPIVMSFAIRYEVNHCTYWDNNNTNNFQIEFIQLPMNEPAITRKKCFRSPGYDALLEMSKKDTTVNGKSNENF